MFQSSSSQNWVELEDYCQEILCELDNPYKTRRLGMDCRDPGSQECVRTHPAGLDAGHPCRHDDDLHFHVL